MQLTTNLTVAMIGAILGVKMKKSGSSTAVYVAAKIKLHGNKLLTRVARFAALLRFQYITQKKYKKKNLKAKYERS